MMVLQAEAVDAQEADSSFVLGFAEDDEDGVALCLVRTGARHRIVIGDTEYEGGIEGTQLAQGWLKLTLTREAAAALALDVVLVIQFPLADTAKVRDALARILAPVSG